MEKPQGTDGSADLVHLFDWMEYTVFTASLLLNVVIGIYFGFIKKSGQDTVEGYMLGGKQMKLIPVSLSLIASFISGITLLGIPAEVYEYGTQVMGAAIAMIINGVVTSLCFLPLLYQLQLLSLYEYLERRFDQRVRKIVSALYIFVTVMWVALAVYIPALAMNQVTGLSVHMITSVASFVCIFYTTVGGLKAVVWTDAIQTGFMVASLIVVLVVGTSELGGVSKVLEVSSEGDRLVLFDMDPRLTTRMTFWSSTLGYSVFWIYATSTSSAMIQRFLSLPTKELAIQSLFWYVIGCALFFLAAGWVGLLMYVKYQHCDPLTTGIAKKSEQITPMFVLEVVGHIKGVPGLFLSGVFAAALSTMATAINAVAAILYEDFVVPCMKKRPVDSTSSWHLKWISFLMGVVVVAMVFLVEKMGAVIEISSMFGGAVGGIMLATFTMGIFFPSVNARGALTACTTTLLLMAWALIGFNYYARSGAIQYPKKVTSVEQCSFNITTSPSRIVTAAVAQDDIFPLYRLSIFYYSVVSFVTTLLTGIIVSKLSGGRKSTTAEKDLFHPIVHGFLIEKDECTEETSPLRGLAELSLNELTSNIK